MQQPKQELISLSSLSTNFLYNYREIYRLLFRETEIKLLSMLPNNKKLYSFYPMMKENIPKNTFSI